MNFGQILRGDANSVQKKLQRIFGKAKLKLGIMKGSTSRNGDRKDMSLVLFAVCVHKVELQALLDTSATQNVMYPHVVRKLSPNPENTSKVMRVATGD